MANVAIEVFGLSALRLRNMARIYLINVGANLSHLKNFSIEERACLSLSNQ